jgi:hypothetical protein
VTEVTATAQRVAVRSVPRCGHTHGRREALFIEFTCEGCDTTPVLRVMQHKGQTLADWV